MTRIMPVSFAHSWWALVLCVLLACVATAQHTTVAKNGDGGRIETDYNAAGKVTEMRTFGADGKLQQKAHYEYLPGYYGAQQTDTTYWSSGKVRKQVRHTYDESTNFTGESIQTFDESGKQVGGHKLTHVPWTGVYRCSEWNRAAQDYKAVECPSGEEESGGAREIPKFTYDEVTKNLEAARNAAQPEQQIRRMQPTSPTHPPITTAPREVGLVLPAELRPGERVSGRVVADPEQYEEMPEVTVTRVAVPFEPAGEGSRLSGWWFEAGREEPQRADGPIALIVPRRGSGLKITFREAGNSAHSVSKTLSVPQGGAKRPRRPNSFHAAALCLKGQLCTVSGRFGGDSRGTFAAFEDRPAMIVAETSDTAYLSIPELTAPGARPLFIAEGSKVVALPVVVGEFVIKNNGRELKAGETLIMFPTLDGPGDLPGPAWQSGNFPPTNLERARWFIPGFELLGVHHAAKAKPEDNEKTDGEETGEAEQKNGGEILLVIKNATPEQISLRGSTNQMLIFHLRDQAFQRGEFQYDLLIETKRAGKVGVKGYVIPLLAPVTGQEFAVNTAAH